MCRGQSGPGAGFLRVLQFPLPIFISQIAPQSPSAIIRWGGGTTSQTVTAVPSGLSPTSWKKKHTGYSNFLYSFDQLDLYNSRNRRSVAHAVVLSAVRALLSSPNWRRGYYEIGGKGGKTSNWNTYDLPAHDLTCICFLLRFWVEQNVKLSVCCRCFLSIIRRAWYISADWTAFH
jgi:hypothetical protein